MKSKRQISLHQKIISDITAKIQTGGWSPGHRIPIETELAETFGVSRMTVNKALTQLTRDGLLERRRKLGTIVRPAIADTAVLAIADIASEVASLGLNYGYQLLECVSRVPTDEDLRRLPVTNRGNVVAVQCLHLAAGTPFCCEERLIHEGAVPEVAREDFKVEPPGPWLLRQVPWHSAKHVITAASAAHEMAKILHMKPGAACLVVERLTEFNGAFVTHVRFTYPGDRHRMVATFSPGRG